MNEALLDTDTVSAIVRGKPPLQGNDLAYAREHGPFKFSAFTRYEVRRGLAARQATRRLEDFEVFSGQSEILPITTEILDRAAVIWGELTNNVRHFNRIPRLTVVNWLDR